MADADPRNRTNHYGSQPKSSVRGLQADLDAKQDADPKLKALAGAPQKADAPKGQVPVYHGEGHVEFKKIGLGPSDLLDRQTAEKLMGEHGPAAGAAIRGTSGGSAAMSIGLAVAVASLSLATTATASVNLFHTEGYRTVADGGETWYRRMAAPEASEPGMLTSSDGVRLGVLPRGPVSPEMFGAYGDDTHNDAAAFATMESWRIAKRKGGTEYGYSYGSVGVRLNPSRAYYCGTGTDGAGWNVYTTVFIDTPNGSGASGLSSVIRVAAATSGVIFHSSVSTGVTSYTTDRGYSSTGSFARGLAVTGGFTSTESSFHGIQIRCKVVLVDPWADNFPGHGIVGDTFSYDGIHNDNINGSSITNAFVRGNNIGIWINYNDANGVSITNPQMFSNRTYGIYMSGVYFFTIIGGNSATNGCVPGFPTQVFNNGHVFGCLPNQESWCSTNSPPSTATNNQGWYYLYDAAGATAKVPQWQSGTTYRSGGQIRIEGGSATGTIITHEPEGDQMPYLITGGGKVLIFNTGIQGGYPQAITQTGTAYGGTLSADQIGLYTGSITLNADNVYNFGHPSYRASFVYCYRINATVGYQVGANQVLGARDTGWAADTGTGEKTAHATYTAGTTLTFSASYVQSEHTALATRLAAVETALQNVSRGQKSLKDALLGHGAIGA